MIPDPKHYRAIKANILFDKVKEVLIVDPDRKVMSGELMIPLKKLGMKYFSKSYFMENMEDLLIGRV
eukprot:CAMPEP_0114585994 /NCGR_PEP_ID=MMETSP0125-20121206/9358_1 /TAXON_ID=485358 ORGANISM="Aristerostoma sp., Strain ATCC 50986" /NCGR_SAMPLE_ID=MMETSP0125 /ASSEMBLY_ACC=CAM_ASM_000245 /LENGTH=66 /DNA_ID=CAMNT_0001781269 /DNA_START=3076 /DNA_END=3276 /DNA_ORIENTATION=+